MQNQPQEIGYNSYLSEKKELDFQALSVSQSNEEFDNGISIGRRILASFVDLLVIVIVFLVLIHYFGITKSYKTHSLTTNQIGHLENSSIVITTTTYLTGLPAIIFWTFIPAYFTISEWVFQQTLGKLIFGIKVIGKDGSKITFIQSLKRNLLRIIDAFPYFVPYLMGFIILSTNKQKQRIGDKLAKTLVVIDRNPKK